MKITKQELANTLDENFINVLKKVYLEQEKVNKTVLSEQIERLLINNDYSPSVPRFIIDYDKGNGVSRPVPVFNPIDYGVYYFCIKQLEENIAINRVEGTYGGWSLGGKIRHLEDEAYEIEDIDYPLTQSLTPAAWARYYGDYNGKILNYINSLDSNDYIAVELDIANFYDTIRLDILENKLRLASRKENSTVIDLLFHFLKNSNKQIHLFHAQSTGIPQDMIADCSRLLANFYLQDYDLAVSKYCSEHGIKYLRYADDQILFIPKGMNYKEAVKFCSNSLYRLGLNVNQKKVKIYELDELLRHRGYDMFGILDPGKSNSEQNSVAAEQFAANVFNAIMDPNGSLKNSGASLLRKAIAIGIDKLTNETKSKILHLAISEDFLPYLDHVKLSQLYSAVGTFDKQLILGRLELEALQTTQSAFLYECLKFAKRHRLDTKHFKQKISEYNKKWTTS